MALNNISKIKLGDIITLEYGKGLVEAKRISGKYNVYGSSGMVGTHNSYFVEGPGIIIGRKGSVGEVYYSKNNFCPIDTTYYIKNDSEKYDIKYLYYYLKSLNLKRLHSDVGVPGLKRDTVYDQLINFPFSLNEQKKISSLLSVYDDLIENNGNRIKLLEEMAQRLYTEWFVKFRFPEHEKAKMINHQLICRELPESWTVCKLGSVVDFVYGKALKADFRVQGAIPVYGSSGLVGMHNEKLAKGPSIIVGRKGNMGSVFWVSSDFYAIDTTYYIRSGINLYFIYYLLKSLNFISSDVAVPGLSRNQAYSIDVIIPNIKIIDKFAELIESTFNKISILKDITIKLIITRDLLMSQLVTGKWELK